MSYNHLHYKNKKCKSYLTSKNIYIKNNKKWLYVLRMYMYNCMRIDRSSVVD
jgi:hypothetical protein